MCSVCSVVWCVPWFTYLVVNALIANLNGDRIQAIMKGRLIERFT